MTSRSYELDQSRNVSTALQSVLQEAVLGALLTGLVVLVFLRDWRSSAIVVITIRLRCWRRSSRSGAPGRRSTS